MPFRRGILKVVLLMSFRGRGVYDFLTSSDREANILRNSGSALRPPTLHLRGDISSATSSG